MAKIPFKKITSREELLTRIENNKLSVGCFLSTLQSKNLIFDKKTQDDQLEIEVTYSSTYGNATKKMYV